MIFLKVNLFIFLVKDSNLIILEPVIQLIAPSSEHLVTSDISIEMSEEFKEKNVNHE